MQAVEQDLGAQQALEFGALGGGVERGGLARLDRGGGLRARLGGLRCLGRRRGLGGCQGRGQGGGAGKGGRDEGSNHFLHGAPAYVLKETSA